VSGTSLPETGRLAVDDTPNGPFRIARHRLHEPGRDEVDRAMADAAGRHMLRAAIVP